MVEEWSVGVSVADTFAELGGKIVVVTMGAGEVKFRLPVIIVLLV